MDVIIVIVMSALGSYFGGYDFFVLSSIISLSLSLYKKWLKKTNDNAALQ